MTGLLNQSTEAGAESLAELKHSARLSKTFLVGCENKAKAQHSWGLGLAELGNTLTVRTKDLKHYFKVKTT